MLARSMPGSDAADGDGRFVRISSRRRDWMSGCLARRWVAQVKADDVVSWLHRTLAKLLL